jgi:hypothetical protein
MAACVDLLESIEADGILVLDSLGDIIDEYLKQRPHGFPQGPGDLFFVWAVTNQATALCSLVSITRVDDRRLYAEFPSDPALAKFDPDDHKFVAAALASPDTPPIFNAADSDWWDFFQPLAANGIVVNMICPEPVRATDRRRNPARGST